MTQLYSTGEVARMLGIALHRITYAITNQTLPEPEQRHARQRCFTNEDIRRIATYFEVAIPPQVAEVAVKGAK